ncbi:YadA family autotransporter adhesin [Trinickia sp. EG282A]|uniref:YadA family autotransporter adhesin n=1 Tax=Trinickia sp. EG282A TaxID=3237013 RepID=UPI0034D371DB
MTTSFNTLNNEAVKYDTTGGVTNFNSITLNPGGTSTQIHNVAAGTAPTDAVNVSQLTSAVAASATHYYSVNDGGTQQGNFSNNGATGTDSIAAGPNATASGANGVALGSGATSSSANAVALGNNAQATAANSVALGANATTTANLGQAAYNPGTGVLAGTAPIGEVSVGSAGNERRITNVAAGAAATDAVNVSQLQSVESQLTQTQNNALQWDPTANGGTGAYNADHGGTGPNVITNVAPGALSPTSTDAVNGSQLYTTNQNLSTLSTTVNNIQNGAGIKYFHANSTAVDSQAVGTDSVAIGPLAVATGNDSLAAGNGAQAQFSNALALGSRSTVSVADGVAIGSGSVSDRTGSVGSGTIAAGSHVVSYNTTDENLLGAVSFGVNGSTYRQLTNVADGSQPNDAVTVRQLTGALASFSVTPTKYFHANSTLADSLAVGAQSIAVGPTTVVNGDNGIGIGNGAIVSQVAPGGVAIGEAANSGQPDAIALGSGSTANGAQSIAQGANSNAGFTGGIALGSGATSSAVDAVALGAGAQATFANSVALGAGSLTTIGALSNYIGYGLSSPTSSVGEVNVGFRQITGLAPGKAATDAVNVSQLQAVQQQLTTLIANGGSFSSTSPSGGSSGTTSATPTGPNSSAGGSGAVASGSSSTAVGNNSQASGNGTTAVGMGATATGNSSTAIGAGSNDGGRSDVVAVGSTTSTRQVINVAAGTAPNDAVNVQQLSNALSQANSYTDNQIAGLRNSLDSYRRDADGGVATAMAVAGLPQPTGPGKSMVAIAGSVYRGQSGQALGVSTISENNHWIYKAAVSTNTRGTYGAVVGAGYQW